jgi:HD-GYP domain-containing protein (c-di-GMP phosphodiesterase class II)
VDVVDRYPHELLAGLETVEQADVVDLEPVLRPPLGDAELDSALEAIGDFCDLRCHFFAGHAVGTARVAEAAAAALGLDADDVRLVRRAALVHDVGRFGVPGQVWSSPGPLSGRDRERMQMHSYYVERIFARPEPLRRVGLLAATHHERLDGQGYHRHLPSALLARPARLLAAADAYHAMLQQRPHRPARDPDGAAKELQRDAAAGRLDPESVEAVVASASHRPFGAAARPAGLTTREIDVLRELCCGRANKEIASRLGISTKTVGNHIEHIYSKLGVTNRASVALAASRLGLFEQS